MKPIGGNMANTTSPNKIKQADRDMCAANMNKIYILIGQLVEASQMIEGMFQEINVINYFVDNNYDEENETISGMPVNEFFEKNKDGGNDLIKNFKMTLGNAFEKANKNNEFPTSLINGVLKVIKERNEIIHYYFRLTDYYTNWNNEAYFKAQIDWLTKRVKKTRNVCDEVRKYQGATLWEDRWDKSLGDHKPLTERH